VQRFIKPVRELERFKNVHLDLTANANCTDMPVWLSDGRLIEQEISSAG
jgi:hypothetical protein